MGIYEWLCYKKLYSNKSSLTILNPYHLHTSNQTTTYLAPVTYHCPSPTFTIDRCLIKGTEKLDRDVLWEQWYSAHIIRTQSFKQMFITKRHTQQKGITHWLYRIYWRQDKWSRKNIPDKTSQGHGERMSFPLGSVFAIKAATQLLWRCVSCPYFNSWSIPLDLI